MSKFWMTVEDPDYDEDGILIDEAAIDEYEELEYARELENFDPFETVNS